MAAPAYWVDSIVLDGVELDLAAVFSDLTIQHGRGDVYDDPTASTCTLTLLDPPRSMTSRFTVGVELEIWIGTANSTPPPIGRSKGWFKGRVTDAELVDPTLRLIAAGALAELNRGSVYTAGWPAETWSARVARFLTAAGLPYTVRADPAFDPILEPPPEDELAVNGYMTELARTVGAAVYDDFGTIVVDPIFGRGSDPARIDLSILPPDLVGYPPVWEQQLDVTNTVTVYYGPDRSTSKSASDSASIALYGQRRLELETTIQSEADALARAQSRLVQAGYPRWKITPIQLLKADPSLEPKIGYRVQITELPPSSPYAAWSPVVEGWVDRIDRDSYRLELLVSDPLASGFYPAWLDAGATFRWMDAAAGDSWADVTTPAIIGG